MEFIVCRRLCLHPLTLGSFSAEAIEMLATRFRILGETLHVRLVQELQKGEKTVSQLVDASSLI